MPKSMKTNQRSFEVVAASGIPEVHFGRYIGVNIGVAAKKAAKQVFKKVHKTTNRNKSINRNKSNTIYISMRESTRWEPNKDGLRYFACHRTRHVQRKDVSDTLQITQEYEYAAKEITEGEWISYHATTST